MSVHHTRLSSRRHERWARLIKHRDGWRCRICGRAGKLEADHIVPLHRGGEAYSLANGQTLCRSCHIQKSRLETGRQWTPAELAWQALVAEELTRRTQ